MTKGNVHIVAKLDQIVAQLKQIAHTLETLGLPQALPYRVETWDGSQWVRNTPEPPPATHVRNTPQEVTVGGLAFHRCQSEDDGDQCQRFQGHMNMHSNGDRKWVS